MRVTTIWSTLLLMILACASLVAAAEAAPAISREALTHVTGVVSGLLDGATPGFVLQVSPEQTLTITTKAIKTPVAVGDRVQVQARKRGDDVPLEAVTLTQATDLALAVADTPDGTPAPAPAPADAPKPGTPAPAAKPAPPAKPAPAAKASPAAKPAAPATGSVSFYAAKIRQYNARVPQATATTIARHVLEKSKKYGVDPQLVFALLAQESRFDHRAVSRVGAQGLGQLMPGTAKLLGVRNAFDIAQNIDGSVRYLAQQLKRFGGDVTRALAAYNAGPGNVLKYGGVPPFRETQNYVRVIHRTYSNLRVQTL